jgi:hypothetical protein
MVVATGIRKPYSFSGSRREILVDLLLLAARERRIPHFHGWWCPLGHDVFVPGTAICTAKAFIAHKTFHTFWYIAIRRIRITLAEMLYGDNCHLSVKMTLAQIW